MTKKITKENGSTMITVAFCRVGTPPTMSIARVSRPMARDQKMRSQEGASLAGSFSREVKLPSTSAPESAEVT
ncbi:hypothetical protein D9M68_788540 [compost metagenome]